MKWSRSDLEVMHLGDVKQSKNQISGSLNVVLG
jgi:hypothetical protein